jgi:hypothetical protein
MNSVQEAVWSVACSIQDARPTNPSHGILIMACSDHRTSTDRFTQQCRDVIRMLSYEDILACAAYLPPLLFMAGPAAIVVNDPMINCLLNAVLGCAMSWMFHCMGHRFLMALPNQPQAIYVFHSVRLPVKLRLTQLLWMLEIVVAAALFSGIVGKRLVLAGTTSGLLSGLALFGVGLALFFLPVYLGRLWIKRYFPTMPLLSPTEEEINTSLPGLRSIFQKS